MFNLNQITNYDNQKAAIQKTDIVTTSDCRLN